VEKCGTAGQATDDNIVRCMRVACRILETTDTHSEFVMLIVFQLQQRLQERASVLRSLYVTCLVVIRILEKREWSFQTRLRYVHACVMKANFKCKLLKEIL
jgi:hypothetical protein